MLSSRISGPTESEVEIEDIFSASISALFTDDTQNIHGTPGQSITYHSPLHGDIHLAIPQHPDREEGRKLFAHYLWNAGIVAAEAFEQASHNGEEHELWTRRYWDVRGKDVLDLGAGTALTSLIAAKSAARSVTITDHPSSPALTTHAIHANVLRNLNRNIYPANNTANHAITQQSHSNQGDTDVVVAGYLWGTTTFTSLTSTTNPPIQPAAQSFDKIIIADCLWMPSQHIHLLRTIVDYLKDGSETCALIVAGFHTGRATVSRFFDLTAGELKNIGSSERIADLEKVGGKLKVAEIFEVDVNLRRRDWVAERTGETKDELRRWCVVAVLVRT